MKVRLASDIQKQFGIGNTNQTQVTQQKNKEEIFLGTFLHKS